jgi:hypothetical protein
MSKRNQISINLDDNEARLVDEYCRANDRTQQWLFKAGARKLIEEDMRERRADMQTIKSWQEINDGLSEPIDDLLEMIDEDREIGREMVAKSSPRKKRSA